MNKLDIIIHELRLIILTMFIIKKSVIKAKHLDLTARLIRVELNML